MKLKRLILSGFKSFADRTTFDFDDGITCVVGPNGCGKSNLVDAVRWVLGERSAKSLRGQEMADVLFNGSAGRKAAGVAEVTLVFDNASGMLRIDSQGDGQADPLVSVTRRLYRSGQSEYQINKSPCRLKDIHEMFLDTGVGRDAYSLIEQGKVEAFLQASHEDRRGLFDEAAGISKYKARKREAERKLERVEQNLLRLQDILEEVQKRLRSIKHQAGKARNYQTYSRRLAELRSLHVLARYATLSAERAAKQKELDAASDALAAVATQIDQHESAASSTEVELLELDRTTRELRGNEANVSQQIVTAQQRIEMLTERRRELGEQVMDAARRGEALEAEIAAGRDDLSGRERALAALEAQSRQLAEAYETARAEHAGRERAINELQARLDDEKAGTFDLLRRTAQLHNQAQSCGHRRQTLIGQRDRLNERSDEIARTLERILTARAQAEQKLADVRQVLDDSQQRLDAAKQQAEALASREQDAARQIAAARERRSAVDSRMQTLREMLQRQEGVGAGVRRVLQARAEGALSCVRGMLGDFVSTDVDRAPLVEAALAGMDQRLVVAREADLLDQAAALRERLGENGAAEVLCCDGAAPLRLDFDAAACPDIRGRVLDWVRSEAWLAPVLWRLLGRTFVVKDLAAARRAARAAPAGARFVTEDGVVREADGTVRFGSARRATGVISRRSELADLQQQSQVLATQIDELRGRCEQLHQRQEHVQTVQHALRTAIYEANTERVEAQSRLSQLDEQIEQLRQEQPVVASDLEALGQEMAAAVRAEHEARQKAEQLEQRNAERQREVQRLAGEIAAARQDQDARAGEMTEAKVALATAEQKKLAQRDALGALQRQIVQQERELASRREQIAADRQRAAAAEAEIETTRREVDRLYARQQEIAREVSEAEQSREGLTEKLNEIRASLQQRRGAHEEAHERVNACRLELSQMDVRIEDLISRAADEMQMDLPQRARGYEHDPNRDWQAVADEIDDLRGKIERLGNVNLDAIAEQDELQKRQEFLAGQLDDVRSSQKQLTELIRRINRRSRERFNEAFETIRTNFREIFRKLFGGGKADMVLADPDHVLDSGIEIYARPPGKELRSLSLLSGGEKTLTALALLFAIFRSRPSPFCLLDEVDAALDEANNERFTHLLGEFTAHSQFVVISHAKRTMRMANVLYGVTMQEPGVSQRISVRFEEAQEMAEPAAEPVEA